jgi:DNA-binding NtrC family response regulator
MAHGETGGPQLRVLVADDERLIRWSIETGLERAGFEVQTASDGEECLNLAQTWRPEVIILDVSMPKMDGMEVLRRLDTTSNRLAVIMLTAHGTIDMAVSSMKLGAVDFIKKPFEIDDLIRAVRRVAENVQLKRAVEGLSAERAVKQSAVEIVGVSPAIVRLNELVQQIGTSGASSTVLIRGPSGSGKAVVAKALHDASRAEKPFLSINCTSLPNSLVESEFFGHERGAFTDAKQLKKGLFELGDGGTVLLDEIGDMHLDAQAKLLQFIEERTFRRVGGLHDISVNVLILAATHRNLEELVAAGHFRADLFHRLNVVALEVPPLRDHIEDLEPLIAHFVAAYNRELSRSVEGVTPAALNYMKRYPWPGNVRELRNAIERAYILGAEERVDVHHLSPQIVRAANEAPEPLGPRADSGDLDLGQKEEEMIRAALAKVAGNVTRAAELLGISRDTLRYRMKKHDIRSR